MPEAEQSARPAYPEEFRREAVQMLLAGRTPRDLGVSEQTLRNWRSRRSTLPFSEASLRVRLFESPGRRQEERSECLVQLRCLVTDQASWVAVVLVGVTTPVDDESTAAALPHGPHP